MAATDSQLAADLETTPYRLVQRLARGGMGEVYVVRHAELETLAVMKLLRADISGDAQSTQRLRSEGRLLTALSHQSLVRVLDLGWTRSKRAFLVTELLDGETLEALVSREGPLPAHEAIAFAIEALEGLAVVHENDIVHRDIKPENLFVVRRLGGHRGSLKILDFGIAKVLSAAAKRLAGPAPATGTGTILGTPNYISPEQVKADRAIDARADIYAMGAVLFFMLTGRPPFVPPKDEITRFQIALLRAHLLEPPPRPSTFGASPPALDVIVLRAMAKAPGDRYTSAREMADALRAALPTPHDDPSARPPGKTLPVVSPPGPPPGLNTPRGPRAADQASGAQTVLMANPHRTTVPIQQHDDWQGTIFEPADPVPPPEAATTELPTTALKLAPSPASPSPRTGVPVERLLLIIAAIVIAVLATLLILQRGR